MIVDLASDIDKKKALEDQDNSRWQQGEASGSSPPPPSFDASQQGHELTDISGTESTPLIHAAPEDQALGPPPEFAPYRAEHFALDNLDVVSHDPHLNTDGEALFRFLLSESQSRPSYILHCRGTHSETRSRWVQERDSHGHWRSRQQTYSEMVTDFDFCIEIFPEMPAGREPIQWSVRDDEPAYRGKMVLEYEHPPSLGSNAQQGQRNATRKEVKKYTNWAKNRARSGYPPWIQEEDVACVYLDPSTLSQTNGLRSSKTLRQWADEYCASPKYLKEFVYEKILYGWNIEQIENVVRSTIKASPYNGSLEVNIHPYASKIYVRPNNTVSRMLSNKWLKFLSIILFIFPFIWLFKRFHSRGGGRWEVCGGAYALKQWVPLSPGEELPLNAELTPEELPAYDPINLGPNSRLTTTSSVNSRYPRYMQTATGPKKLIGLREGEWFRSWEAVIQRAVIGRYQSQTPLTPGIHATQEAQFLDGYNDRPPLVDY